MKNPRIPPGPLLLPCGMSRTDRKRRPRSPTLCRRQPPSLRLMIRVSHASFEEHNARRGEARQGLRTWLNARLEAAKGYGSDRDYAGRGILRLRQPGVRAFAWRRARSTPNPGRKFRGLHRHEPAVL